MDLISEHIVMELLMKLDSIQQLWEADSKIDINNIVSQSAEVPVLHAKYWRLYINEKVVLRKFVAQYKALKLAKAEFLMNPNREDIDQYGWKVPTRGKLLRTEVPAHLEGDRDLLQKELEIGVQEEKVEYLKSILDQIGRRGFLIKNIIDEKKFMNGG